MTTDRSASGLDGTWEMIRAELGGENSPDLLALKVELEVSDLAYTVRFAGQVADRGTVTLGSEDGKLTLVGIEGPNVGCTIPCIYQLVGDRLRVCYGLDGTEPVKFETIAGSPHYLATYRRQLPRG
jgi:uncharacterized protein (TIGR03067 family)